MTIEETGIIMDILSTAYPKFYSGNDAPDPIKTLSLWAEMFAEDKPQIVAAAVKALIATDEKGYPPHIGAVKAKMRQITQPEQNTEMEAWGIVLKAISRGIYNSQKDFDAFPSEIQRIVGSPNQIREWAMMDSDTVQSVIASNFQRSYRAKMKQKADFDALPNDVKQLVGSLSSHFELSSGFDSLRKEALIGGKNGAGKSDSSR